MCIIRKSLVIIRRGTLTGSDILIQVWQFSIQNSSLNTVQARVNAHKIVVITHKTAVISNGFHFLREFVVVGEDSAAVAVATKVLRGEETGAADVTHCSRLPFHASREGVFSTYGLARVLHYI